MRSVIPVIVNGAVHLRNGLSNAPVIGVVAKGWYAHSIVVAIPSLIVISLIIRIILPVGSG